MKTIFERGLVWGICPPLDIRSIDAPDNSDNKVFREFVLPIFDCDAVISQCSVEDIIEKKIFTTFIILLLPDKCMSDSMVSYILYLFYLLVLVYLSCFLLRCRLVFMC